MSSVRQARTHPMFGLTWLQSTMAKQRDSQQFVLHDMIDDILEFSGEFRWLSNFWPCPIVRGWLTYGSVECAYMSEKSDDPEWKAFCLGNTPGKVKRASREIVLKPGWDDIKVEVMRDCIDQKFSRDPFKGYLLATWPRLIVEGNDHNDDFWGVCHKKGTGKNMLGQLLMTKRELLRRPTPISTEGF